METQGIADSSSNRRWFVKGLTALGASVLLPSNQAVGQQQASRRILLAHGLLGFSNFANVRYFDGVAECFPGATFITPQVEPAGLIRDRAAQLEKAITDAIPAAELSKGRAVHIVAHSMGGLDARYLISQLGRANWIASLTTISTPHRGSPLADIITGARLLSLSECVNLARALGPDTITNILAALGQNAPPGVPLNLFAPAAIIEALPNLKTYLAQLFGVKPQAFSELTTASATQFNKLYPSLEGVPLACYSGVSSPSQTMCRALFASWAILNSIAKDNDGAVPLSSSRWPETSEIVPADHFEEVGLARYFDLPLSPNHYDIRKLYSQIDAWQKSLA